MGDARVRFSITDGVLEVEGSEEFVTAQLDRFDGFIKSALDLKKLSANGGAGAVAGAGAGDNGKQNGGPHAGDLAEVFAATSDGVQILKDIPGGSKPQKTVNAARLLLFGMKAVKGKDTVLFEDVKKVCKAHGFYDMKNMAYFLKGEQGSFVFGGSGKKQTLQLTIPGEKETKKLVQQLQAGIVGSEE